MLQVFEYMIDIILDFKKFRSSAIEILFDIIIINLISSKHNSHIWYYGWKTNKIEECEINSLIMADNFLLY